MLLDAGNKDFISQLLTDTEEATVLGVVAFLAHRWGMAPTDAEPTAEDWDQTESETLALLSAVKDGIDDGTITAAAPAAPDTSKHRMTDADKEDAEILANIQGSLA